MTMKRLFDFICASVLIILTAIPMAVVAVAIHLNMGKPILFRQERPGLHEKSFYIYKFRTMTDARDEHGELLPNKDRLTSLGLFLRKTSLDELPQLWNIIRGELSLVGPRPLRVEYLPLYTKEQARRHDVLPGITGWAQINGRNNITWEKRLELDVWYVDNQSFLLDLKILFLTLTAVLRQKGISPEDQEFMETFKGSKEDE